MTTKTDEDLVCALCHQSGGWLFKDYGSGIAHTDCLEAVGVNDRPTLEELQRAERQMYTIGYVFRDSCGRMHGGAYHDDNIRRYHVYGYALHFASWASFGRWLDDAFSYVERLGWLDDDYPDGWNE